MQDINNSFDNKYLFDHNDLPIIIIRIGAKFLPSNILGDLINSYFVSVHFPNLLKISREVPTPQGTTLFCHSSYLLNDYSPDEKIIQVKDAVGNLYTSYDGEYSYTPVQDALSGTAKHKIRHRREKGRQSKLNKHVGRWHCTVYAGITLWPLLFKKYIISVCAIQCLVSSFQL